MIIRNFIYIVAFVLLQSCAASQSEIDIDHNATSSEQTESGDDRGFDPCLLNPKLPVCT